MTTQTLPLSLRAEKSLRVSGVGLVLAATFGLALKGIWARLAYAEGLSVSGVLFYRSAFSAPLVLGSAWFLLRREGKTTHHYTAREFVPGIALGVLFSVGMFCDFEAISRLGASVSRVVLFGFPLVVLALDSLSSWKLPARRAVTGFVIAWLGLLAVASRGGESSVVATGHGAVTPLLWGVASMLLYGLYVWLSGRIGQTLGSVRLTCASNLTTAAVVVAFVLVQEGGAAPPASQTALGWIALMVLVSTVAPYFLLMEGIRRLGASEASLLAMTGPLVTVMAGWMFLGESLSSLQLLGTGLIIVGVSVARKEQTRG